MNRFDVQRAASAAGGGLLGAAALFALVVGFSMGWFGSAGEPPAQGRETAARGLERDRPGPVGTGEPAAPERPRPEAQEPRVGALEEENRRLKGEVKDLEGRLTGVLNWVLTNFKGTYPLPSALVSRLQVPPVTDDYTLHPEAAAFIKVTPDEERQLNDVFAYARAYLAEIEAALLTVTSPRPDKIILHIPPFAEHGRWLREDLYSALEVMLGPDRFDRFLTVSESGLKSSFYRFGEASRTLVFELAYAGEGEPPQLKIKDGWILESPSGDREIAATQTTVTNLPPRYAAYSPWLPDSFVRGFAAEAVR